MQERLQNDYYKDKSIISKSQINRKLLNEMHIPKFISVEQVKNNFDKCNKTEKWVKVGNPLNKKQQKHIRTISKYELYKKTIKGD